MVLHRSSDAEANLAVYVPGLSVFGFDVYHHQASQWCERVLHVVMLPVHMCISRYFGHYVALAKQIDGKFGGSDEVAPQGQGKPVVDSAQDRDKVVFERLDRPLSHVPSVAVGRY